MILFINFILLFDWSLFMNKKKGYIIELFGLPGSGKSTISKIIKEELRKENIVFIEPKRKLDKEYNCLSRYIFKIYYTIISILLYNVKIIPLIFEVIKLNHGKIMIKQLINVCYTLYFYKIKDNFILDEGIVQALVSASYSKKIDDLNLLFSKLPSNVFDKVILIYINIDVSICCERVLNRKDGKSRVDRIKNKKVLNFQLSCQKEFFNNIKNNLKYYEIDNSNDIPIKRLYSICNQIINNDLIP